MEIRNSLHKIRIRRLCQSYKELLTFYTQDTGKAANEVFAIEVLQWAIKRSRIGKLS